MTIETKKSKGGYTEAVGRRKTSVARVRITPAAKTHITINGKEIETFIPVATLRNIALEPITKIPHGEKFTITVTVAGGGISGQAEAIRHGIARALFIQDGNLKVHLRKEKMLTRDSRAKERRKFGLKKARKAPQWSKR